MKRGVSVPTCLYLAGLSPLPAAALHLLTSFLTWCQGKGVARSKNVTDSAGVVPQSRWGIKSTLKKNLGGTPKPSRRLGTERVQAGEGRGSDGRAPGSGRSVLLSGSRSAEAGGAMVSCVRDETGSTRCHVPSLHGSRHVPLAPACRDVSLCPVESGNKPTRTW